MAIYRRKPAFVEATQFRQPGEYKISQGALVAFVAGDWLVKANGKSWIVEGDIFFELYEELSDEVVGDVFQNYCLVD